MFIAYYSADNEFELCDTFEEAKKWLEGRWEIDAGEEGYSEETTDGGDYIAKVTHNSKYIVEGDKERDGYKWNEAECGFFIDGDADKDQWPVSDQFDKYGRIELEEFHG
jgi:hypothetical protein